MTDVLILRRIPGAKPGQILPLDARLEKAVKAGNAKILPSENPSFAPEPQRYEPVEFLDGPDDFEDELTDDEDPED